MQGIKYFDSKFRDPVVVNRHIPMYVTCCTDTEFMKVIVSTVIQSVMEGLLSEAGFSV